MNGAGATMIGSGGSLLISGGDIKGFTQRTLNNAGTIRWSGGDLWSGIGATLNNQAGGLFDLQSDQSWSWNQGGAPPVLNNAGTAVVTASTNIQSGTQDPYEDVGTRAMNERIVIVT